MDEVFKALADRRPAELLDRLRADNGQTLGELCARLDMTRQAVSKHLGILEGANLVATVRRGREKLHYLNPVPIHEIAERWIGKFERSRLQALSELKKALEEDVMSEQAEFVYVTYIRTTPEKLWAALTDPADHQEILVRHHRRKRLEAGLALGGSYSRTAGSPTPAKSWRPTRRSASSSAGATSSSRRSRPRAIRAARWRSRWPTTIRTGGKAVKLTIRHELEGEGDAIHRGGVRRLAEDPVEPQIAARNRRRRVHREGWPWPIPRKFKPKTVYVTYIAATPEKVWQALIDPAFSKQYFFGFAVDIEPRTGGRFRLLWPMGACTSAARWSSGRRRAGWR